MPLNGNNSEMIMPFQLCITHYAMRLPVGMCVQQAVSAHIHGSLPWLLTWYSIFSLQIQLLDNTDGLLSIWNTNIWQLYNVSLSTIKHAHWFANLAFWWNYARCCTEILRVQPPSFSSTGGDISLLGSQSTNRNALVPSMEWRGYLIAFSGIHMLST